MKITPVKGTNDYLPQQMRLRDFLQSKILETYLASGFERIATPIIEDVENLDKSEGGDNLNLIFKIMKRGDKLTKALNAEKYDQLADLGLRYDLTLPLCRYYANNRNELPNPFKVIQMDRVYRAEQPQKGRMREFVQCDIDIIGSASSSCEVELIDTTAKALLAIGMKNFRIKVNDRRILKDILLTVGFEEAALDSVCITFDKLDKIGAEGVKNELTEKGFDAAVIEKFGEMLEKTPFTLDVAREYCSDPVYIDTLQMILDNTNQLADGKYDVYYDKSLVRGQGYYTGTVFEIESMDFGSSVGGGGRYDNLVGKFIGDSVPAVGFSIGFERIFSILSEQEYQIPGGRQKVAVLYDEPQITEAVAFANSLRGQYDVCLFVKPKKVGKLINRLPNQGFAGFCFLDEERQIKWFGEEE